MPKERGGRATACQLEDCPAGLGPGWPAGGHVGRRLVGLGTVWPAWGLGWCLAGRLEDVLVGKKVETACRSDVYEFPLQESLPEPERLRPVRSRGQNFIHKDILNGTVWTLTTTFSLPLSAVVLVLANVISCSRV